MIVMMRGCAAAHDDYFRIGVSFTYRVDAFSITAAEDAKGMANAKLLSYLRDCRAVENWEGGSVIYPTTGFTSYTLTLQAKKELIDDALIKGDKSLIVRGCSLYKTFASVLRTKHKAGR